MSDNAIVTLTTDFGHKGPFVGVMKGVILSRLPDARIIDLTHEIHAHWPAEGGFWLSRSHGYFPAGTVHVAVVDPGVGTSRDIIAAEFDGQTFLAPDNGILAHILGDTPSVPVYKLGPACREQLSGGEISATFHGRDLFAPLAAEVAAGRLKISKIGEQVSEITPSLVEDPVVDNGKIQGAVVAVDSFGNLISNIDGALLTSLKKPVARCGGKTLKLQDTYGRSQPGELLALINSFGVVEIARAESSAADYLGLGLVAPIVISGDA